jgi:pilus assembly protein CpaE
MKIVVASRSQAQLDQIRGLLAGGDPPHQVEPVLGKLSGLPAAVETARPDVLILDDGCTQPSDLSLLEGMLHRPGAPVAILLCKGPTAELLLQAMRVGVREVLPSPVSGQAIGEALGRIAQRAASSGSAQAKGQVLAFVSCKGGGGATFLATNLAYALAEGKPARVAVIDLNLQAGDAVLHLSDRQAATSVADVVRNIGRLDGSYLAASMISVLPNLGLLAAPGSAERALDVRPEHIDALLDEAVNHYDYVILDLNRVLDAAGVRALDRAGGIFPVLQLTVPFVRDAKRLLATFESLGYDRRRIQLVVNRYEKGGELGIKDVERTLDLPVPWIIPNSFRAVTSSVNQGVPIAKLFPHDPVARSLQAMAATIGRPRGRSESWVREMLHLN